MADVKYLEVMAVVEKEKDDDSKKSFWPKVGVAFPLRDGSGFMIYLDAYPTSGKLMVKPPRPRKDRSNDDSSEGI